MKKSTKFIVGTAIVAATGIAVTAGYICYIKNKIADLPENFTVTAHTGCGRTSARKKHLYLRRIKRHYHQLGNGPYPE